MPEVKAPRTSLLLRRRIQELGITRSDFIRKLDLDFEKRKERPPARNHVFKVINGQVFAGENGLLPKIVKCLGLDLQETLEVMQKDKIDYKGWSSSKAPKTVQDVALVMESLSKRDQEDILRYAKMRANIS